MKQFIRDYLTFNKRERNGLFVLLAIITSLLLYLNISDKFISLEIVDFTKFEKEIDAFNTSVKNVSDSLKEANVRVFKTGSSPDKTLEKPTDRFDFDPNDLPEKDWQRLGLNSKLIHTIKNYESKGGKFRSKEDVRKIYGIKEELYASLEPFIKINSSEEKSLAKENKKAFVNGKIENISDKKIAKNESSVMIELNSADSTMLTSIKGIGPFYAKNIIKYRNSIGGFVSKEQLLEIWKFDQEKLSVIEKYITIDPEKIKKLNINTCEASDLKNGYIKWNVANAIVNYRKNHGKYKAVDEIKKTDLVDDETYRKIAPYLIIDF